jgi:hypothetical protein
MSRQCFNRNAQSLERSADFGSLETFSQLASTRTLKPSAWLSAAISPKMSP